jgi:hypothetical protein
MCRCTPIYDMPLLRAKQSKVDWHVINPLLRTCLVYLAISIKKAHSRKSNELDDCMVQLFLVCLTWYSGSIWHVCGLVGLVFDLENEL